MSRQVKPGARKSRPKAAVPTSPAAASGTAVKITAARGRPMLVWVGKRPLTHVTAFPAQHVETFDPAGTLERPAAETDIWKDWPAAYPRGGLLLHGDNEEVLAHLLANGFRRKVNLVYIDPPFDSGADYVRKVTLRGVKGTAKIDGEGYTLGEQVQYTDIWANDNYLQFMYERLLLLRELLADNGAIYLHCDPSRNSYLRALLDEVFGPAAFVNEIVWQRLSAHNDAHRYGIIHDTISFYSKSGGFQWNPQLMPLNERYIEQFFDSVEEETGRRYARSDLTARGLRRGETGKVWRGIDPAQKGNHWKVQVSQLEEWDRQGRIHWPKGDGMPRLKRYLDEVKNSGMLPQDVWYDVKPIHNQSSEMLDFPTQKPEALVARIISTSSDPNDIVLDCFIGSGTTAAVAQKTGRRWIGCDVNKGATQTTAKRLQAIIQEQIAAAKATSAKTEPLPGMEPEGDQAVPNPAQLGFTVWRVNDYDLQIQHNEAVTLACEHIGIERSRTDSYFDGTLGRSLVKIIPFGHPLTPLDLEELKRELDARPDEDRAITLVCLGIELAAKAWIDDWNRLRKGKNAVNRIEVIELRTDPRYGKFIKHEPARARVKVTRGNSKLTVEIEDFISPTIIERLQQQAGLLQPKIDDWRAMVDSVMIDPTYDGKVFNVAFSDVPERKSDLVVGKYELSAPENETTVAVKITDMLGEEVLTLHTA